PSLTLSTWIPDRLIAWAVCSCATTITSSPARARAAATKPPTPPGPRTASVVKTWRVPEYEPMTHDTFLLGGDLEVRRLGFGAMRITGPGIWGPPEDPAAARSLLRDVVETGVNLIDTADAYGPEVS